ncbi:MAG: sugar ABC transporter permease [Desulfurococcales archaeon]|nr:sugar ABC transporter permease [Desulfurococcales archaeon]
MRIPKPNPIWFFLSPALFLIIVFYVVPLFFSIYISFTPLQNWNLARYLDQISLENYERLFYMAMNDPDVTKVVKTTIVFVTITLIFNVLGGLILALSMFFMDESLSLPYRLIWILPRMTPIAVYSLIWYYFFLGDESGTLNSLLLRLGVIEKPLAWGNSPELLPESAWAIIILVNGLVGVSFGMVVFYSALRSLPREHVIAARVEGASAFQMTRYVLVPQLKWHIIYVTVWQLLSLITTYAHIFLLVQWGAIDKWWGSPWALYVFNTAFTTSDQGFAAAAAVILVVIGGILGILVLRLMGFKKLMQEPKGEL